MHCGTCEYIEIKCDRKMGREYRIILLKDYCITIFQVTKDYL